MEHANNNPPTKKRPGRRAISPDERLVLVAGRVPPATRQQIELICQTRDWKISDAIKAACELLVKQERRAARTKLADC